MVLRNTNGFVSGVGGLNEPLAKGFELSDGLLEVEVPSNVPSGTDYQVVCEYFPLLSSNITSLMVKFDFPFFLYHRQTVFISVFGDSGNESPSFTIANPMVQISLDI